MKLSKNERTSIALFINIITVIWLHVAVWGAFHSWWESGFAAAAVGFWVVVSVITSWCIWILTWDYGE